MRHYLIIGALALSGCTHYERPGADAHQLAADEARCKYEATKATGDSGNGVLYAKVEVQCMNLKGYRLARN